MSLHRHQHRPEPVRQLVRRHRSGVHTQLLDRPFDRQPALVDRAHVLGVGVAQQHVVAVADQPRADGAADRPRADDDIRHGSKAVEGVSIRSNRSASSSPVEITWSYMSARAPEALRAASASTIT